MDPQLAWLGIGLNPDIWRLRRNLADKDVVDLYRFPSKKIAELMGVDKQTGAAIRRQLSAIDFAAETARLRKLGIDFITISNGDYPEKLRSIYDPPPVLFTRGKLERGENRIAIVGARCCTAYGRAVAYELARDLASAGVTVVSGLARGIDTAAHEGALAGGRTIAVMGCGLDITYPLENHRLSELITGSGAVLSEYPPGIPPRGQHFPARNRIVSGLSEAVVVVEASKRSGALITADFALEQGREVMVVPGSVRSPASAGCHELLKQGAALVSNTIDVLEGIGLQVEKKPKRVVSLEPNLARLLGLVGFEKTHVDNILSQDGRLPEMVLSDLSMLELESYIARETGGWFIRLK